MTRCVVKKSKDSRRHARSQEFGTQKLEITFSADGVENQKCEAALWDFSDGGLGMDSPRSFETGEIIEIQGNFFGPSFSMRVDAKARVAYCRRFNPDFCRVGVAFIEVSFKRIKSSASSS